MVDGLNPKDVLFAVWRSLGMLKLEQRFCVLKNKASRSGRRNYSVLCPILALLYLLSWSSGLAASPAFSSAVLSGATTNALLHAYESLSRTGSDLDAPFVLENDSIEIVERSDQTLIGFFPNRVKGSTVVTVKDGQAISRDSSPIVLDVKPTLLPGVIAGEIIAAYSAALRRNDLITRARAKAPFNVEVLIGAGGSLVSFIPQQTVIPPGYKCIAGNCDARSNYLVRIETGKTVVTHRS
jgi:hypothetical protein